MKILWAFLLANFTTTFAATANKADPTLQTLPLQHYEKSLHAISQKKPNTHKVKPNPHAQRSKSNLHVHYSTVLPKNTTYKQFNAHVADVLGWVPTGKQANFCHGVYTVPQYLKKHPLVNKHAPIEITAKGPEKFKLRGVSTLQNTVIIKQPGRIMYADKVYLFRNKKGKITRVVLRGHVRIYQQSTLFVTDEGIVTFYPHTVTIRNIAYRFHNPGTDIKALFDPYNGWGTASFAKQNPQKVITLEHATFSTCSPRSPAWQLSGSRIILDQPNNVGKAYNMVFRIKNIPVFYFPYYSFPLNNERSSGLLFPVLGQTSNAGAFVGLPIYFNLAPNYDLLATPQYYGKRGFRLKATMRYLTKKSTGFFDISFLPQDLYFAKFRTAAINTYSDASRYDPEIYTPYLNALKEDTNFRGMLNAKNITYYDLHTLLRYHFNLVTDPYYLADISTVSASANSTTTQLLNMLQLQFGYPHWETNLFIQGYQTLHLITQIQKQGQALDQYRHLPDLNQYGFYPLGEHWAFQTYNEFAYFDYFSQIFQDKPHGARFHLRPSLSYTLQNSAAYLKPELWYDITAYTLSNTPPGTNANSSRLLPMADVDMGLHLIRHFHFQHSLYEQTLTPRLFYLYVPFTTQDQYPNFDTIQLPFFFDQLYALNTFQSYDRIENANQLSLGLDTNIIRSSDGSNILNASIGDIYYIKQPKVCLIPGCQILRRNFSPLIATLSFHPNSLLSLTGKIAWDPKFNLTNNAGVGLTYNDEGKRVFNLSYQFVGAAPYGISTFTPQTSFGPEGAQNFANSSSRLIFNYTWPLGKQVRTLGYLNYDLRLHRFNTIYAGLQYDTCCWAIRFIIKRLYDSSTLSQNHALNNYFQMSYFVELTFKGLGSFGQASDALVQNIVPGYKT